MAKERITRAELEKKLDRRRFEIQEMTAQIVDRVEQLLVDLGEDKFTAEEKKQHIEAHGNIFASQYRELLERAFEVVEE